MSLPPLIGSTMLGLMPIRSEEMEPLTAQSDSALGTTLEFGVNTARVEASVSLRFLCRLE
jgi:hypothetical protein